MNWNSVQIMTGEWTGVEQQTTLRKGANIKITEDGTYDIKLMHGPTDMLNMRLQRSNKHNIYKYFKRRCFK